MILVDEFDISRISNEYIHIINFLKFTIMGAERFAGESAVNLEQKCLCVLVLDVSGSMRGNRLDSLNKGLRDFFDDILHTTKSGMENLKDQLEVAIIQYDEEVQILRNPQLLEDDEMPPTLTERGSVTETVMALEEAIKLVDDRKSFYKSTGQPYYRPWIILMTDGEPYGRRASQEEIDAIARRVQEETAAKRYMMMGIAVGEDANMTKLKCMTAGQALSLQGTKFTDFFKWLSKSLSVVSNSKSNEKIDISEGVDSWMKAITI